MAIIRSIQDLLDKTTEELEKMSDAELNNYFTPMFPLTRPANSSFNIPTKANKKKSEKKQLEFGGDEKSKEEKKTLKQKRDERLRKLQEQAGL